MKSTSKKSATKPRARRITFDQVFGPDPLGFKQLAAEAKTAAPTAEEDVIAEATRRAVVGKQRLPGKRRRRKASQRDRLQKAIAKREREIGTLKRALKLLDEKKPAKRSNRAAVSLAIGAPL